MGSADVPSALPSFEQRAFPRVAAPVKAQLVLPDGRRAEVPVRDISAGGLFLFSEVPIAAVGALVWLELEKPNDASLLPVRATVVRHERASKDPEAHLVGQGLRFELATAEERASLDELVAQLLAGSGGKRRGYPRIAHRIEVACPDVEHLHAVLRDLSLGGAGLWLDTPVANGQQLTIERPRAGRAPLRLTGKVVSTVWAPSAAPYDQAGVQFQNLSDSTAAELKDYLAELLAR
jgi:c-di-GMP-binding flagellar brake protein YcgR